MYKLFAYVLITLIECSFKIKRFNKECVIDLRHILFFFFYISSGLMAVSSYRKILFIFGKKAKCYTKLS